MIALSLLAFIAAFAPVAHADHSRSLVPFVTDGCTLFSEGPRRDPDLWEDCCVEHDLAQWMGGSRKARQLADRRLFHCVASKGEPEIAHLMYLGVRLGRLSPYKLRTKKWGNAWGPRFRARPLTRFEIDQLESELRTTRADRLVSEEALQRTLSRLIRESSI